MSDKFRHQLRQEAKLWQAEGLINESLYQQLSDRYQLDNLEKAASDRFVTILISLGGILLGLGVITFVAANWQEWSREVKIILLLSLFIAVNTAGFYLWRQPPTPPNESSKKRKLGQGLLIFGALILGANIAFMAQMFHIGGSPYGLYLVWGFGVIAMAYGLRLTSLGVLGIILIGIGYWQGWTNSFYQGEFTWLEFLLEHIALVAALVFVPLAYWCRSRAVFFMALLVLIPAAQISSFALFKLDLPAGLCVGIFLTLPAALLWGYDDTSLAKIDRKIFQPLARNLAIWYLSIGFTCLSFHGLWNGLSISGSNTTDADIPISWFVLIDVAFFIGFTIWQWFRLAQPGKIHPQRWGFDAVTSVIGGFLAVTGLVLFWQIDISEITELATFIINIEMFLLAAGLIRIGLVKAKRHAFWGGLVLLTVQIMSRTFEYNTGLLLKSLVFVLCGVGVILAGLWFERHLSSVSLKLEEN